MFRKLSSMNLLGRKAASGDHAVVVPAELSAGDEFEATIAGQTIRVLVRLLALPCAPNACTTLCPTRAGKFGSSRVRLLAAPLPRPLLRATRTCSIHMQIPRSGCKPGDVISVPRFSSCRVKVPAGVAAGQQFPVTLGGRPMHVEVPPGAVHGDSLKIGPGKATAVCFVAVPL